MIEDADLFGPTVELVGAGVSKRGRPRLPIRLMVSLLYFKQSALNNSARPHECSLCGVMPMVRIARNRSNRY